MPFTPQQLQQAEAIQRAAAQDGSTTVRLVAGPGTGKSFTIQERVRWLLATGVDPDRIFVVSFTRASARDLRSRIHRYCVEQGIPAGTQVSVTTLHSLALRVLRGAGLLEAYPADPIVMDKWELENIFDAEFSNTSGHVPTRCEEIRREHEAFWNTGAWGPPTYIPPDPPITPAERSEFTAFHTPRTQIYSCVLPGEIVRQCVAGISANILNPVAQLHMEQLIVDESQDLNPIDLQFIDALIQGGVTIFVAGDDDQSIYSFRFASPTGIQTFTGTYGAAARALSDCFRCAPAVVGAAVTLIGSFPLLGRIPKTLHSMYTEASPPVQGQVMRWRFQRAQSESRAIAESCRDLIAAGTPPREILILLSNRRMLGSGIAAALTAAGVPYDPLQAGGYLRTRDGRFVVACLRVACDPDDYVAHRTLLGARPRVGVVTCRRIGDLVVANALNFWQLFHHPLPQGVFPTRETSALDAARAVIAQIVGWQATDTLAQRAQTIEQMVSTTFGHGARDAWLGQVSHLPPGMTLQELRDYLGVENDEQQGEILTGVYTRLGEEAPPAAELLPQRVRVMTMHGAKGLSSRIVFIPALEERVFPGPRRQPYPGLILEAARLLYVSISRARAACVVSYASTRIVHGEFTHQAASRFTPHLGGAFVQRTGGMIAAEIAAVIADCAML